MDPILEFSLRAAIFMAVFLLLGYFLFRHIERIRIVHGEPEDKDNYMAILKHYFLKKLK